MLVVMALIALLINSPIASTNTAPSAAPAVASPPPVVDDVGSGYPI